MALFFATVQKGGHFHKASCVNALSLGRPPYLADANTLGQLSLLYVLVRTRIGLQNLATVPSASALTVDYRRLFVFPLVIILAILVYHSCLPTGSQYITCKLQNCSDGNKGKPFPGFIIPNSLVVQDEYVFIQVGFLLQCLALLKDN